MDGTETAVALSADMFNEVLTTLTTNITPSLILGVIAAIVGVSVGFVFIHWGARKVTGSFMAAFQRGKLRV